MHYDDDASVSYQVYKTKVHDHESSHQSVVGHREPKGSSKHALPYIEAEIHNLDYIEGVSIKVIGSVDRKISKCVRPNLRDIFSQVNLYFVGDCKYIIWAFKIVFM